MKVTPVVCCIEKYKMVSVESSKTVTWSGRCHFYLYFLFMRTEMSTIRRPAAARTAPFTTTDVLEERTMAAVSGLRMVSFRTA